jgi:hypothetical protein
MIKKTYLDNSPVEDNDITRLIFSLNDRKTEQKQAQQKRDTITISEESLAMLLSNKNELSTTTSYSAEWDPEIDPRVTAWVKENWEMFIHTAETAVVKKGIQAVIGLFFKELSKKAGGIIGDLISPTELNTGENEWLEKERMKQNLMSYLDARPDLCIECGACADDPSAQCPVSVFGQ